LSHKSLFHNVNYGIFIFYVLYNVVCTIAHVVKPVQYYYIIWKYVAILSYCITLMFYYN